LKITFYDQLIKKDRFTASHMRHLSNLLMVKSASGEIDVFWKRLFLFEAYHSISIGIRKLNFTFPAFSDAAFSLESFYHPLLKDPVKNSISTRRNVVLLTGPNMSGKSTFLKSVMLCVYLGHLGLGVPASKAAMPVFQAMSVSINLNDDMLNGYSHLMTELITLKKVVTASAAGSCFAVFDELFRGTNMEDSIDITRLTIKGLSRFTNSLFFISTHLHQLKDMDEVKDNEVDTYHLDCELVDNKPKFSFRLAEGWSDLRIGRILFENEGLYDMLSGFSEEAGQNQ
jgi:DNA mismatch repair protein MutS